MLAFIHIGKTGGSAIYKILTEKKINFIEYHNTQNYNINKKFIIWVRNPLSRFVSAFNYLYYLVNYDCRNKKVCDISVDNCLGPLIIKHKIRHNKKYIYDETHDNLINFFQTPNYLARSLTSNNPDIKAKALLLMNSTMTHIFKGIGWYLDNGKFIMFNKKKILFVGKQETMEEDIEGLSKILNTELNSDCVIRKNIYTPESSKYLSPLAIKNLINFYKDTDYAALKKLNKHGWISDEVLALYYTYT